MTARPAPAAPTPGQASLPAGKNADTLALTEGLAADAAGILERDYGIDAGEVLSMNVDTVETVTGGIEASSPNFADVVNSWDEYGQKTFSAAFGDKDGNILERTDATRVTTLPEEGKTTTEAYVLAKYNIGGTTFNRTVVADIPAGKTASQLLSEYGLTGVIFSDVGAGSGNNSGSDGSPRGDNKGWWGTGLFNPDEYEADNIHATFNVVQGGSLNDGFCFNITVNEDITYSPLDGVEAHPISGYFFNVSHHGDSTEHKLFKMENWRLDNSFSVGGQMSTLVSANCAIWCNWAQSAPMNLGTTYTTDLGEKITLLSEWTDDGKDIDYDVTCKDGSIQIYHTDNGNTRLVADVKDNQFTKGTYGFWGNNCEQKGQAQISNLNVEISKTYVKSFGDIVYEPNWTDGALHMLINMDTASDSTMLGKDNGTESSTRLLDNGWR